MEIAATFALFALGVFLLAAAYPFQRACTRWVEAWLRHAEELHQAHVRAYDEYHATLSVAQSIDELIADARSSLRRPRRMRVVGRHYARVPGFVYLLSVNNEYYKIGLSQNVKSRVMDLQSASPYKIEIVHIIATDHSHRLEVLLQGRFSDKWTSGEWYRLDEADVASILLLRGHITLADLDRMEAEIV